MIRGAALVELAAGGARIHLMGVGGAGMAGLALLLKARGARVSGCDQAASEMTADLEERGIEVMRGHGATHVQASEVLIHTAAVPADHAEVRAARDRGLVVLKRSEALADLVNAGTLVAVSGTHGKTTTTALAALALEAAGADPTALVGGRLPNWKGNARIGGETYVVEADEYDRSFLRLQPRVAVVTSVEAEHLDTYGDAGAMEAAFDEFAGRVPDDGRVVACVDDPGARRRLERRAEQALGYGLSREAELRGELLPPQGDRTRFQASWRSERLGEFELGIPGEHNVRNALAALGVVVALGFEAAAAAPALASFKGVERRFQRLGEAGGVAIVDDYAHHPTEVMATLGTAREVFPGRRLVAAFQPHLYTRTRAFAPQFGQALAAADLAFITAIYPAREAPIPGVTAERVVEAAREAMGRERIRYAGGLDDLIAALSDELRPGDVLVTLGAGDITRVAHAVLKELRRGHVDA